MGLAGGSREVGFGRREVWFGGRICRVGLGRGLSGWVASEASIAKRQQTGHLLAEGQPWDH